MLHITEIILTLVSIIAALGQEKALLDQKDFIYFSVLKISEIWKLTPTIEQSLFTMNKCDIDGLYKKCGIIRFALFGKFKLLNGIEFDPSKSIESKNWTSNLIPF